MTVDLAEAQQRPTAPSRLLGVALFNGVLLLAIWLSSKSFTYSAAELAEFGHAQPLVTSGDIAARTGVPLLFDYHVRRDNPHSYERLEEYSVNTDYDHLDAVLWDVLALFTDIRGTKTAVLQRNYLFYLASIWLFSLVLARFHGKWAIGPAVFVPCALLVFLPPVQTLLRADYVVQGMVPIAPAFMAVYLLALGEIFSRPPRSLRYWLPAFFAYSFFLGYISVIHSANQSSMIIMTVLSLPLIWLKFRPGKRLAFSVLCASVLGVVCFGGLVLGLREYRDRVMGFTHSQPVHTDHTTFSIIYIGIGSFPNSIGLTSSDDYMWIRGLIEEKAAELGVEITPEERAIIGDAPKAEFLYFRMWAAYMAQYPFEYIKNRIQANAWVIARFALRGVYPAMSPAEQVFWCVVAVLSWGATGLVMYGYVAYRLPIESIVILLAAYVPMALMGILHHPVRGVFSALPVLLAVITTAVLLVFRVLSLPSKGKAA